MRQILKSKDTGKRIISIINDNPKKYINWICTTFHNPAIGINDSWMNEDKYIM